MKTGSKLLDYSKLHLFGIELVFLELENYHKAIESFLEAEKARLEKKYEESEIEEKSKSKSEDERDFYNHLLDEYAERYKELALIYPHNFRASILTQIISFIEFELKKICDHHQMVNKQVFGVSDLKGNSDIEKCKTYLKKVCNINFSNLDPEWSFIDNCRIVRNKIVHRQGIIQMSDNDYTKVNEFVSNQDGISCIESKLSNNDIPLTEFTLLITGKDYCGELLSKTKSFFRKLLKVELKYVS